MLPFFLIMFIGAFSAAGALGIRYAERHGVPLIQLNVLCGGVGAVFFLFRGWNEWSNLSMLAVVIGIIGGFTQYVPLKIFNFALKRGPLSPVWCAFSLGSFVPAILAVALFQHELPTLQQFFSLLASIAAIVCASLGQEQQENRTFTWKERGTYLLSLLLILILAGVLNAELKCFAGITGADGRTIIESQQGVIMTFVYLSMALASALELTVKKEWTFNRYYWIGAGLLTVEAVTAYNVMLALIHLSATLVFALNCTVSILCTSVLSTFIFHEKRTLSWYMMVFFSIVAICLNLQFGGE